MNFKTASDFDKITQAIENLQNTTFGKQKDERFWQPTVGTDGNGFAVVRFMPAPQVDGESGLPFVGPIYSYAFKGPTGKWYNEYSLTTLGNPDPVTEYNGRLWKAAEEAGDNATLDMLRGRSRRVSYISNIYVVDDAGEPENNDKIFLFRYGKKLFAKWNEAFKPAFEKIKPINPFDLINGANFLMRIKTVKGSKPGQTYRNYDNSQFDAVGRLNDFDDNKLDELWKQSYSLTEFVSPDIFKSYDELRARLEEVLGHSMYGTDKNAGDENVYRNEPVYKPEKSEPVKDSIPYLEDQTSEDENDEDEDEMMKRFKELAKE